MDVIHTAVEVSDLDATREFYEDALGLAESWQFALDGVVNHYVAGEDGTEIQFKHDPEREEPVEPSGIDHLAVSVDDAAGECERLVAETGCEVVLEPTVVEAANARAAFVTDPDGYVVELVEDLGDGD